MVDYTGIGKQIKDIRKSKRLTQAALAEKSGIEPSNISHIERGATKLSLPTLISIANALNASLDEIVYSSLVQNRHITIGILDDLISDCSADEIAAITEITKTTKTVLRTYKR